MDNARSHAETLSRRAFVERTVASGLSAIALSRADAADADEQAAAVVTSGRDGILQARPDAAVDFIDRRWVEHTYFLTRKVTQPERFSKDPIIVDTSRGPISVTKTSVDDKTSEREDEGATRVVADPGRDPGWGGNPASAMGTVVPTKDGLVMWYVSPHRVEEPGGKLIGYDKVVRYAVSQDGRHFEQPKLNLCEFRGSRENNIIIGPNQNDIQGRPLSGARGCSGFCVLDAERQNIPHARGRFTAIFGTSVPKRGGGLCLAWSDDGLRWNAYDENPVTPASDTYCNFHYDPRSQRYALYIRPSAGIDGLRAGPLGVRSLLSRIESADLIHWDDERVVFDTDEADAPARGTVSLGQINNVDVVARGRDVVCYGMTVSPHQEGFVGIAQLYDTVSGKMWCELAHSYDGIQWLREPRREPFIAVGADGAWDSGMVGYVAAGGPAEVGDDWYYYYTGNNWTHHFKLTALAQRGRMWQIGGVRLPRGRLVGYRTGDPGKSALPTPENRGVSTGWANKGELLTRPFAFQGSAIRLNADAGRGRIITEICDAKGKPIPGFSRPQAVEVTDDGVRLPLEFSDGHSVAALNGQIIRLRMHLESAAIFGLSFL